jgi:hypothetical protein
MHQERCDAAFPLADVTSKQMIDHVIKNAAFPLADMTSDQEILQMIGTDRDSNMFVDSFSASLEEAGDEGIFSQVQAIFRTLTFMEHGRTGIETQNGFMWVFFFCLFVCGDLRGG